LKRRSANRASRTPPEPLTYFTDRDLAKKFPAILQEAGLAVVPYRQVFRDDPTVPDREWIRTACQNGWVSLTHDSATRKDEDTLDEVFRDWEPSGALFILKGGIPTQQLAEMFLEGQGKVERMVRKHRRRQDPFIGRIRRMSRKGGRQAVEVVRWADRETWRAKKRKRRRQR